MDNRRRPVSQADDPRPPHDVAGAKAEVIDLDPVRPSAGGGPKVGTIFAGSVLVLAALVGITWFPSSSEEATSSTADASLRPRASLGSLGPLPDVEQPLATPGSWVWSTISLRGYGRGATVENLWALGDQFVAEIETDEGPDGGPYGPVTSVLLTSTDGLAWSDDGVDLPINGFVVSAGTIADGRLWVLGYTGSPDPAQWQLWSTDDGTWRHEADAVGLIEGAGEVTALAYRSECEPNGDCGAVGWVAVVRGPPSADEDLMLVSDDGRSWRPVELAGELGPRILGPTFHGGRWVAAAAGPSGESGHPTTIVLMSRDRVHWSSHPVSASQGGGRDIASGVAGIVIVGTEEVQGSRLPRVWLSSNGERWLKIAGETPFGLAPAPMDHVTATAHGYLAMSGNSGDAWLSTDGEHWWSRPAFAAGSADAVRDIAAAGDVLLAAGRSSAGRPTFWVGSLAVLLGQS